MRISSTRNLAISLSPSILTTAISWVMYCSCFLPSLCVGAKTKIRNIRHDSKILLNQDDDNGHNEKNKDASTSSSQQGIIYSVFPTSMNANPFLTCKLFVGGEVASGWQDVETDMIPAATMGMMHKTRVEGGMRIPPPTQSQLFLGDEIIKSSTTDHSKHTTVRYSPQDDLWIVTFWVIGPRERVIYSTPFWGQEQYKNNGINNCNNKINDKVAQRFEVSFRRPQLLSRKGHDGHKDNMLLTTKSQPTVTTTVQTRLDGFGSSTLIPESTTVDPKRTEFTIVSTKLASENADNNAGDGFAVRVIYSDEMIGISLVFLESNTSVKLDNLAASTDGIWSTMIYVHQGELSQINSEPDWFPQGSLIELETDVSKEQEKNLEPEHMNDLILTARAVSCHFLLLQGKKVPQFEPSKHGAVSSNDLGNDELWNMKDRHPNFPPTTDGRDFELV